ncbi:MAG: lysylphosphatidylglycerol synthase domain-containing protein [Mycobacteriales bacterium]
MRLPGVAVRRAALATLLLGALALALWSLAGQAGAVRAAGRDLSAGYVAAAAVATLASLAVSLLTWRGTLAGVGVQLPVRPAAQVFFVGQLGKYLPGSVWSVMAQMELGVAHGLSRTSVGTASLLALAVGVPGALVIGLLAVPALLSAGTGAYALVFLVLPLAVVALWPPVLNALLARALRLLRRPPLTVRLTGRVITRVALLSGLANVLLGGQAALLALDLGARGPSVLPVAIGAFTLANVAGLLALPVPAGAGVREVVLVAGLSPVLPLPTAVVLALASRALLTAADLAVAGTAVVRWRRFTRTGDGRAQAVRITGK